MSYEEFMSITKVLFDIVRGTRTGAYLEFMCDTNNVTYTLGKVTCLLEFDKRVLAYKRPYSPDTITQHEWNKSLAVTMRLIDPHDPEAFMISISCDRHAEPKKILFYGQSVDEPTRRKIGQKFFRSSLSHSIGSGTV